MTSIEMSVYEDLRRDGNLYDEMKKEMKTDQDHKSILSWRQWLIFFVFTLTISLLSVGLVLIVTYITVHGSMENITADSKKVLKLATEIKNMLNGTMGKELQKINSDMDAIQKKLEKMHIDINCNGIMPKDCSDSCIRNKTSGLYTVYLDGTLKVYVQCEEGGHTVIQKRYDGAVEFDRNWSDYENGFGDIHGEFWLGNKNIAQLTSEGNHELRIDLEDWDGNKHFAVYSAFKIGDASTAYRLNISGYSGNAGDGMSFYDGMKFSTYDQDNDESYLNCAAYIGLKGGWWYNNCWSSITGAMLNGHYTHRNNPQQGIIYRTLGKFSQEKSTMKIRKV